MFKILATIIFLVIIVILYIYLSKNIKKNGFNCINMFVLIYTVFYMFVPLISIIFNQHRDSTTLYNRVLNLLSDEEIIINFFLCLSLLLVILVIYNKNNGKVAIFINESESKSINLNIFKKINLISDILFVISIISIFAIIRSVGGISAYLSLGSATRGATSNAIEYIKTSILPLITLSQVILATPYLYYYLLKISKNKFLIIKFILSMSLTILYLLYNQGRATLLLFILPFILVSKAMKKINLFGLGVIFILCFPILNYLNGLFSYLSYGTYRVVNNGIISSFLLEYSYPFVNFANRHELININGFRYGFDYIFWIVSIIPSSFLKVIGLSKTGIDLLGTVNTNAYSYLTNSNTLGGIPVDFLTFNYYEGGYVILFISVIVTAKLLKVFDKYYDLLKHNLPVKIILYRISVSILNIMTNSDFSVIARTRMDVVILAIIIICIGNAHKNKAK